MGSHNPDVFQRQSQEVKSILGEDLEIVEARSDFVVYVTAEEQETSVRGDPNNCMFSNACKRAFGSKGVLFYPSVAYVDMIDPRNPTRRIIMRFILPPETRARLEDFDRAQGEIREATFILKAVPKSQTLRAQAIRGRKRHRLLTSGRREVSPTRSAGSKKAHETRKKNMLMGVRSGVGQIHTRNGD
jgi:hypothetical protein